MIFSLLFSYATHYVLSLFVTFVLFSVGLIFIDAFLLERKNKLLFLRGISFFALSIAFALNSPLLEHAISSFASQAFMVLGSAGILASVVFEPLLHAPSATQRKLIALAFPFAAFSVATIPLIAILFFAIALVYMRRVIECREKDKRILVLIFFLFSFDAFLQFSGYWSTSTNAYVSQLVSQFGVIWNVQHILQLCAAMALAIWAWGYIRFRLRLQLFVQSLALSLFFFLSTTLFFSYVLIHNLELDAQEHMRTNVQTLEYAMSSLKDKTRVQAQMIASDTDMLSAVESDDKEKLYAKGLQYFTTYNMNTLIIASNEGNVLVRVEDNEVTNDSVNANPVFEAALKGERITTTIYHDVQPVPELYILAGSPIYDNTSQIVGAVLAGFTIDNAFVDGVKDAVGMDVSVFGKTQRIATTFLAPNGKSRFTGTFENNPSVLKTVYDERKVYVGTQPVLNQSYLVGYAPLRSYEGTVVGMLFVGKPELSLYETAQKTIVFTYMGSLMFLGIALIPAFIFSRILSRNIQA